MTDWWQDVADISFSQDLKTKLANSTEEEIRSLQSSLNATKAATASDLQRNVYQKYVCWASC